MEGQLAQLLQKACQCGAIPQVAAVAGDVLSNDDKLLHPGIGQRLGLLQQMIHGAAAVAATKFGDDAEGAAVAASLGNLQIGGIGRRGDHPLPVVIGPVNPLKVLRPLPGHQLLHGGNHIGVAAGSQHAVHLGQFLTNVIGVALGQASGHQQLLQLAGLLELGQLQDIFNGLALGRLNKPAGIQHRHVSPLRLSGDRVTCLAAQGHHLLGIHQVLRTAQGDKGNLIRHHIAPNLVIFQSRSSRLYRSRTGRISCHW